MGCKVSNKTNKNKQKKGGSNRDLLASEDHLLLDPEIEGRKEGRGTHSVLCVDEKVRC